MSKHTIVLIPGDGIGPEVTSATKRVLASQIDTINGCCDAHVCPCPHVPAIQPRDNSVLSLTV